MYCFSFEPFLWWQNRNEANTSISPRVFFKYRKFSIYAVFWTSDHSRPRQRGLQSRFATGSASHSFRNRHSGLPIDTYACLFSYIFFRRRDTRDGFPNEFLRWYEEHLTEIVIRNLRFPELGMVSLLYGIDYWWRRKCSLCTHCSGSILFPSIKNSLNDTVEDCHKRRDLYRLVSYRYRRFCPSYLGIAMKFSF
jgi:hypothetical protein